MARQACTRFVRAVPIADKCQRRVLRHTVDEMQAKLLLQSGALIIAKGLQGDLFPDMAASEWKRLRHCGQASQCLLDEMLLPHTEMS